ncbi:UDP-N-acetylmuramoyl-L-alanyl-D-glutamate--2,6-diaminopimelate ligase [Bacillus sp. MUM 13]|uniref:UDP-N-acetylmuramoyl-L-alanyl-D-glutamate--2, 6-diaminopimelate ligase n=1 Tax=Bacillus sp. MUM 13 TaxID=1678001 RepID=UPI0008F5BF26|nr:UDP-N-acetylmuramoyl-L-alanyl-D-glutamate--2,6-diaminopimelate ligase [Bacillus sp. MUM 13]OIK06611.1 UDP-N-acetylmuramoyl-L-alanyl-D-glutamate--2,6-diaminopimelate ligase [Bacillus sp. MUM 13]
MKIKELVSHLFHADISGDEQTEITGLKMDSRKVKPGDLFMCVPGIKGFLEDRSQFAQAAVDAGAVALLLEKDVNVSVPKIFVKDVRTAMAILSAAFYGNPSKEMKVIGVTGTNGKTTTSHILESILKKAGKETGIMGNIGVSIGGKLFETDINTQEPPVLQENLRKMRDAQAEYCVMEVTSQGLDMGRVIGTHFRTAIFTNLSIDHLDYHGTMDAYRETKGLLFSRLGNGIFSSEAEKQYSVINHDDSSAPYFKRITASEVISYGIEKSADVMAKDIKMTAAGTEFTLLTSDGHKHIKTRMIGRFNIYNILAAAAAALAEKISLDIIAESVREGGNAPGRMEIIDDGQNFLAIADYAHTPDALEKALTALKEFAQGRIITVFGCGGNRDTGKRQVMGAIAQKYSDYVIITSDNPRDENPDDIISEIAAGFTGEHVSYCKEADRRTAIRKAIERAGTGDIVFVAGKGHETYQIIQGEHIYFDDREEIRKGIKKVNNRSNL